MLPPNSEAAHNNTHDSSVSRRRDWLTYSLIAVAVVLLFIDLLITVPGAPGIAVICVAAALSWSQYRKLRRRRWRRWARLSLGITVSCLVSLWLVTCLDPAQAQFFQNAETFFTQSFGSGAPGGGGGAAPAIAIVFNALRALYILYLAVSFVGVINAVRQDEDWQTVARTPALVVVVITLADILTTFITG